MVPPVWYQRAGYVCAGSEWEHALAIQTAATQAAMAQHLVLGDLQRRLDGVKHA